MSKTMTRSQRRANKELARKAALLATETKVKEVSKAKPTPGQALAALILACPIAGYNFAQRRDYKEEDLLSDEMAATFAVRLREFIEAFNVWRMDVSRDLSRMLGREVIIGTKQLRRLVHCITDAGGTAETERYFRHDLYKQAARVIGELPDKLLEDWVGYVQTCNGRTHYEERRDWIHASPVLIKGGGQVAVFNYFVGDNMRCVFMFTPSFRRHDDFNRRIHPRAFAKLQSLLHEAKFDWKPTIIDGQLLSDEPVEAQSASQAFAEKASRVADLLPQDPALAVKFGNQHFVIDYWKEPITPIRDGFANFFSKLSVQFFCRFLVLLALTVLSVMVGMWMSAVGVPQEPGWPWGVLILTTAILGIGTLVMLNMSILEYRMRRKVIQV